MSRVGTQLTNYRDQPDEELLQALAQTRDELFRLHLGQHTNQVTSSALLQTKRRDIARILTILRGRKLGFEVQAQKTSSEAETVVEAAPAKKTRNRDNRDKKSSKS
jgi:large subunit ribosomal protein L29